MSKIDKNLKGLANSQTYVITGKYVLKNGLPCTTHDVALRDGTIARFKDLQAYCQDLLNSRKLNGIRVRAVLCALTNSTNDKRIEISPEGKYICIQLVLEYRPYFIGKPKRILGDRVLGFEFSDTADSQYRKQFCAYECMLTCTRDIGVTLRNELVNCDYSEYNNSLCGKVNRWFLDTFHR